MLETTNTKTSKPTLQQHTGTKRKYVQKPKQNQPTKDSQLLTIITNGRTGIGTRLQPTQYAYGAFWGVAELHVDGELVRDNQLLHLMVTENVQNEDYELMIDSELPRAGVDTHVILPPVVVTDTGPQHAPVPTGYELPTGEEQPFAHVMFEDTGLEGLPVLE